MKTSPLQLLTPLWIETKLLSEFLLYQNFGGVMQLRDEKGDAEHLALFSVKPYSNLL